MATPSVPGAINIPALTGAEVVPLQSGGQPVAQTTAKDIANLAATPGTPATSASAGVAGQILFDSSFAYFCVAANTWLRVAIATW